MILTNDITEREYRLIENEQFWIYRAANLNKRAIRKDKNGSVTPGELKNLVITPGLLCYHCNVKCRLGRNSSHTTKTAKSRLLTFDHVVPLCKGGSNTIDNLVVSCKKCNNGRIV